MVTANDFIYLPYTDDLNWAGVAYACRSLHYTYNRMQAGSLNQGRDQKFTQAYNRLERIISGKAVELAVRRHLIEVNVPFDNLGDTPFTDPDRYDISLGGRRCDLKSHLVLNPKLIQNIQHQPALLLQASALVPENQAVSRLLNENDVLIFAFVTACLAENYIAAQARQARGLPVYWMHLLPGEWGVVSPWSSLGEIALKSELEPILNIELGGQGQDHRFLSEQVTLPARQRMTAHHDYHTLLYLHIDPYPQGRVGISSARLGQSHLIQAVDWVNVWVYGMQIILVGYITRREFNRQANRLPVGSRVFQYSRTRTPNLAVPISALQPLDDLYRQVRTWARR